MCVGSAMNRRFQRAFIALKEHTTVSYAKIATIGGFCNVDLIVVKATAPDDSPLHDKYVHELLKVFSISPPCCRAFSLSFTRRFKRTRSWRVALKCLLLLHRLLRSLPEEENSPFRSELLWSRSNDLISLYPCRFQDASSSNPESYTSFIRSYAHLLDEAIGSFLLYGNVFSDGEMEDKMQEMGRILEILPRIQGLIDRVMDCKPNGVAAASAKGFNLIIHTAMKYIIRDSFNCYTLFRRDMVLVLDNLFQMPYRSCIAAFGIYKKAALQANQLWEFYDWCRVMGFCGCNYEYPMVDRIPLIQIQALETFIDGMWQLTDIIQSSPSSFMDSKSSITEDDRDKQLFVVDPLIQLDDDDGENDNWEDLLEASVNRVHGNNLILYTKESEFSHGSEKPNNPFYYNQPTSACSMPSVCSAQYAGSDPKYPWGL